MKSEHTERYTRSSLPPGETDWERVDALTDREIQRAAASDPDAAAPLDAAFFEGAEHVAPVDLNRVPVTLFVDRELLRYYKGMGSRYREIMRAALLRYALERGGYTLAEHERAEVEPVSPARAWEALRGVLGEEHPDVLREKARLLKEARRWRDFYEKNVKGSVTEKEEVSPEGT